MITRINSVGPSGKDEGIVIMYTCCGVIGSFSMGIPRGSPSDRGFTV